MRFNRGPATFRSRRVVATAREAEFLPDEGVKLAECRVAFSCCRMAGQYVNVLDGLLQPCRKSNTRAEGERLRGGRSAGLSEPTTRYASHR